MTHSNATDSGASAPCWGEPWPSLRGRLTDLLDAQPFLVELIWRIEPGPGPDALHVFHRIIRSELSFLILSLDEATQRILELSAATGLLSRDRLLAEAAPIPSAELDLRVQRLHTMGLVDVANNTVWLAPEIAGRISLPLPSFQESLDGVTSERLGIACRLLGLNGGSRKSERAAALATVLADANLLAGAVSSCGTDASLVFSRIAQRSWGAHDRDRDDDHHLPNGALQPWELDLPRSSIVSNNSSIGGSGVGRSGLDLLADRCLIGRSGWGNVSWMWLEAHIALTGTMFSDWQIPEVPPTRPIDEPVGVAFRVLAQAEQLIVRLGSDAPEGKKTGDRRPPVKAIKSCAAAAGVDMKLATIVIDAAVEMGLLMAVDMAQRGRGRTVERPIGWIMNPDRFAEWSHLLPEARWLSLVSSWIIAHGDGGPAGWLASIRRISLVGRLAGLPNGQGIAAGDLARWLVAHHPICDTDTDNHLADLVRLGVVSAGATVGLGGAGRAMLADHIASASVPAALGEYFSSGETAFVVQPDHTIIASADLAPELVRVLAQIAEVESEGGAVVWRLTVARLTAAAHSLDAATVVDFLRSNSTVPVAENVVRFVEDHVIVPTPVTIGGSSSHLVVDDPVLFSRAVAVKAAKLMALAPNVAISSLAPSKLREALVANGLAVELDAATSATLSALELGGGPPAPSWQVSQRPSDRRLDPPQAVPLGAPVVESIVRHLDPSGAR